MVTAHLVKRKRAKRRDCWAIVLQLGRDPQTDKPIQRWVTFYGNKDAARERMQELLRDHDPAHHGRNTAQTVGDLLDNWMESDVKRRLEPTTVRSYAGVVRNHLKPRLGHIRLADLQPEHIDAAYDDAMKPGGRRDGRGGQQATLSPTTVGRMHAALRKALNWAVKRRYIATNPALACTPPSAARFEPTILSARQMAKLAEAARGTDLQAPVGLGIFAGLRLGEALALTWSDVDLDGRVLRVIHSVQELPGGTMKAKATPIRRVKDPKSASGIRAVLLQQVAVDYLREVHKRQAEQRLAAGAEYADSGLVCCDAMGRPLVTRKLSDDFKQLLADAGLPRVRFHDLRHSHATFLAAMGENPRVMQERLGHSKVQVTLDRYTTVLASMQQGAVERLDAGWQQAIEQATKK